MLPSNEGRGYILRRLIRRAYRFGKLMGLKGSFLWKTASKIIDDMGSHYKELEETRNFMVEVVKGEEEGFAKTLDKGLEMLEAELAELKKDKVFHRSRRDDFQTVRHIRLPHRHRSRHS